jgi:mono/diheme cytochrome c family protein
MGRRHDLKTAIDELLAGTPVSVPQTDPIGCLIGRVRAPNENSEVTYSHQIARLFNQRCVECHREGEIGPFALTTYAEAAGWGEMIAEVVKEQRMPPWHADPAHGEFKNARRLSEDERALIDTWVANGCPQGSPADLRNSGLHRRLATAARAGCRLHDERHSVRSSRRRWRGRRPVSAVRGRSAID